MKIPIMWQVGQLLRQVETALEMVCRYQAELEAYSARRSAAERRADVASVLDALNDYASEFGRSGELPACEDIRVMFGLWRRLDAWQDSLESWNGEDYLALMDEHNTYENPLCYLLQPRLQAEDPIPAVLIPRAQAGEFLAAFAGELTNVF